MNGAEILRDGKARLEQPGSTLTLAEAIALVPAPFALRHLAMRHVRAEVGDAVRGDPDARTRTEMLAALDRAIAKLDALRATRTSTQTTTRTR